MNLKAMERLLPVLRAQHTCVQDDITLTFTQEAAGISWPQYMELYCAGAKQLFFHEKSKLGLQLEPAIMSNL